MALATNLRERERDRENEDIFCVSCNSTAPVKSVPFSSRQFRHQWSIHSDADIEALTRKCLNIIQHRSVSWEQDLDPSSQHKWWQNMFLRPAPIILVACDCTVYTCSHILYIVCTFLNLWGLHFGLSTRRESHAEHRCYRWLQKMSNVKDLNLSWSICGDICQPSKFWYAAPIQFKIADDFETHPGPKQYPQGLEFHAAVRTKCDLKDLSV